QGPVRPGEPVPAQPERRALRRIQRRARPVDPVGTTPSPVILLVSCDEVTLRALTTDLVRRFGNETCIIGADGPAAGLARLATCADTGEPVALLIADQTMPEMTGVTFLQRAR